MRTPTEVELSHAAHEGRIVLDSRADSTTVADLLTHERKVVEGTWKLFIDPDTKRGALIADSSACQSDVLLIEDLMTLDIWLGSGGERFLSQKKEGGGFNFKSLDRLLGAHSIGEVTVKVGACSAETSFAVAVMKRARDFGARVFWDGLQIYRVLQLKTYSGQASKWFWTAAKSWTKTMKRVFGPGDYLILSRHMNHSIETLEQSPWYSRCLNAPSMSTLCLLVNLTRWSYAQVMQGGFRKDQKTSRAAAAMILDSLVCQATARTKAQSFTLQLHGKWACRWPLLGLAPEVDTKFTCEVSFLAGGLLRLGKLMHPKLRYGTLWRNVHSKLALHGVDANTETVELTAVFRILGDDQRMQGLLGQICFALAAQLEASLGEGQRGLGPTELASLAYSDWMEVGAADMDEKLLHYVLSGVDESHRHRVMSIATDKAGPAGMSLLNSVVSFPNNKMILCCPQAPGGSARGPKSRSHDFRVSGWFQWFCCQKHCF